MSKDDESFRSLRHPISRWYLCPAAHWFAKRLERTRARPNHLTACSLATALAAAALLVWRPDETILPAALALTAWFFDRADGILARLQGSATPFGAWLDANVDEAADVLLHAAAAWAVAQQTGSSVAWIWAAAFFAGKFLFFYSMATESAPNVPLEEQLSPDSSALNRGIRWLYHLPGNADIRLHLLVAAWATGWLIEELAIVAIYYNLRWIVRYALVARRLFHAPR